YGECYGYVPALALGGSKSIKNLKVVDAKAYIHLIGQAVGKIIDYGE
ncbi:T6SS immunity protein Tdi1 domain-containing protein, partial [Gallibacterium anatis]